MMTKYLGVGVLDYSVKDSYYRLALLVDPELHRYLRSLIPSYYICRPQRYAPHITVVRGEHPVNIENWGRYQNKEVSFEYETAIYNDNVYWWINCFSAELINIRLELGLPRSYHLTRPPDGTECFHSTIGNMKIV